MKSKIKINYLMLFILSIISFCCLSYILFRLNTNIVEALNIDQKPLDIYDFITIIGYLFIIIFHLYAIMFIFSQFRYPSEFRKLKVTLLIFGIGSLLAIGVEKVMVDEIAREYRSGFTDQGEFYILNGSLVINILFIIFMFYFFLKSYRLKDIKDSKDNFADEKVFIIAQYLGILAGILGIYQTFILIAFANQITKFWVFIPFYILFLIPYGISVIFWLILKLKKDIAEWYNEKQFQDILKASLTTLILSVPCLLVILPFKLNNPVYWFMYYLYLVLLLFSGSILFYYKIKDSI